MGMEDNMIARETSTNHCHISSRLCLCNCCGKLHSNCPFDMSMVEDIINEVRTRPELWLSKHPKFRNTRFKGKLWCGIAAKLNIEGDILKKHWKYLKGQFKKELAKCSAKSSDGDDQQVSSWQYFDQLSFLREEFEEPSGYLPRPVMREESPGSDDMTVPFIRESVYSTCDLPNSQPQENGEAESFLTHLQDLEDNHPPLPTIQMPSISLKTRPSVDAQSKSSMQSEYTKSQVTMTELMGSQDDDFFYLMSILPTMKRLSHVQKMRFRSKIEQFLLEAVSMNEYSSYMNNFSPNNSLPDQGNRKRTCKQTRL